MKRAIRYGLALSLLSAACSDDGSAGESFRIDTRGGDALPVVVAYDVGDGWLPASEREPGVYAVPAAGEVAIVVACDDERSTDIALHYLTPTAKRAHELPCPRSLTTGELPASRPVSIVPATAYADVGPFGRGFGTPSPQDTLYAPPGRHDVIASTDTRVLISRGVAFPSAEPLILDIDRDGADLVPLELAIPAVDVDESLRGSYSLETRSGTRGWMNRSLPDGLRRVPDDVLIDGDRHRVDLTATSDNAYRSVAITSAHATGLGGVLPPRIDEVITSAEGGAVTFAWDGAPAGEQSISLVGGRTWWWVVASEDWLAATGQTTAGRWALPALDGVPGWNPAWATAERRSWRFTINTTVKDGGDEIETWTERGGDLPAAP
jgi:hypothetical protein